MIRVTPFSREEKEREREGPHIRLVAVWCVVYCVVHLGGDMCVSLCSFIVANIAVVVPHFPCFVQ